jgi:hypothetical protein
VVVGEAAVVPETVTDALVPLPAGETPADVPADAVMPVWVVVVSVPPVAGAVLTEPVPAASVPVLGDCVPAPTAAVVAADAVDEGVVVAAEIPVPVVADTVVPDGALPAEVVVWVLVVSVPPLAVVLIPTETVPAAPVPVVPVASPVPMETVAAVPLAGDVAETSVPLLVVSDPVLPTAGVTSEVPGVQLHEVSLLLPPRVPETMVVLVDDVPVVVVGMPSARAICRLRSRQIMPTAASTMSRAVIRTTSVMLGCIEYSSWLVPVVRPCTPGWLSSHLRGVRKRARRRPQPGGTGLERTMLTGVRSACCRMRRQTISTRSPARSRQAEPLPGLPTPLTLLPSAEEPVSGAGSAGRLGIGSPLPMKLIRLESLSGACRPPARSWAS